MRDIVERGVYIALVFFINRVVINIPPLFHRRCCQFVMYVALFVCFFSCVCLCVCAFIILFGFVLSESVRMNECLYLCLP